jgi:hypothetical protein
MLAGGGPFTGGVRVFSRQRAKSALPHSAEGARSSPRAEVSFDTAFLFVRGMAVVTGGEELLVVGEEWYSRDE